MRRFILIVAALFSLCAAAHAEELGIKFTTSSMQHRIKPEEIALLQKQIREIYPQCVDTVVAYIGDEGARKYLNTVTIAIQDNMAEQWLYGETGWWSTGTPKKKQSITLFAQMFLTGVRDLETTITHELLHVVMEYHNDFKDLIGAPAYVIEGISYHGSRDVQRAMLAFLNKWDPVLDFDELMKEKKNKRFFSERTFVECFGTVYGDEARKKFVRDFYNGKNWRNAMEDASGEEKWTRVRTKTRACRGKMIEDLLNQADDYREVAKVYRAENYSRAAKLAREKLSSDPKGSWAPSIAGKLAYSLEKDYRAEDALVAQDDLRTGKYGGNLMDADAAFNILRLMAQIGRCEEARAKRADFERFYPYFFKQNWRKELDDDLENGCRESSQGLYGAKKLAHAKQYAEARAMAEDAILKRIEEDGAEKSAAWNRDTRAKIADWFAEEEKLNDASKAYDALIVEFREKAPNERRDLAGVLVEAADVDAMLKQFPTAEAKLIEALALYRRSLGPFDKTIPETERTLGLLYVKMGDRTKARERLTKALEDMIASSRAKSAPRAKTHLEMARFLKDEGDAAGALANAKIANEIYQEIFPADHEDAVATAELVATLTAP